MKAVKTYEWNQVMFGDFEYRAIIEIISDFYDVDMSLSNICMHGWRRET